MTKALKFEPGHNREQRNVKHKEAWKGRKLPTLAEIADTLLQADDTKKEGEDT